MVCQSWLLDQNTSNLIAFIDGGSLGSPGRAGIGVVIDWRCGRSHPNRQVDWSPGQQRRRIRRPDGSVAVCPVVECEEPTRLLRFPSCREANDG